VTATPRLGEEAVARLIREATLTFPDPRGPAKVGIEAELLSIDADTRQPVSIVGRLIPTIERYGCTAGWKLVRSAKGAAQFEVAGGGRLTFEPGGQIEYATPPFVSPSALLENARHTLGPLLAAAAEAGIELVGLGIDPFNRPDASPLQVEAERYRRMDAYFSGIGPAGARMMRQSASIQVNVDAGPDPLRSWNVLNALAPYLTAMFANSRVFAGADTGFASYRARTWQTLDPTRTGLAWRPDAAGGYVDFALDARAMFLPSEPGDYAPFRDWVRAGVVTAPVTQAHLSTLFPEIRPRGWFEVRSIDAQQPALYAAPVMLVSGIALDERAIWQAQELLGPPEPALLERAAREGLRDDSIAEKARELARIALDGCRRLGNRCSARDIGEALEFFQEYTLRGRSPGDDHVSPGPIPTAA